LYPLLVSLSNNVSDRPMYITEKQRFMFTSKAKKKTNKKKKLAHDQLNMT